MQSLKAKTPRDSQVESRYILLPQHANDAGTAFGGTIMAWIDMVGAMVAQKHCGCEVVTVSIEHMSFLSPVYVGEHVLLKASANYVGRTSLEVGVQVMRENPYTGKAVHATTAYLTFVGLDKDKHPAPIPQLKPETPDELRRHENARLRAEARKEFLKKIKSGAEPSADPRA